MNEGGNNAGGREHYEAVGKSKIRTTEQPALDAKYGGVAVSRSALDEEEENDPFAPVEDDDEDDDPFATQRDKLSGLDEDSDALSDLDAGSGVEEDEEIDSDEALGESDAERFKDFQFRGSRKNRMASPEEEQDSEQDSQEASEDDEEEEDYEEDESDDGSDEDSDLEMDDEDDETPSLPARSQKTARDAEREELRKAAFSTGSTAGLASALSAGAQADVKKGQAVKQQRQTFDRLLDARIKLQKGISAMNELPAMTVSDGEIKTAAKQAEEAALALWTTIDSIRCTILSAQEVTTASSNGNESSSSPLKRKRSPFTATRATSLAEIWNQTTSLDATIQPLRRSTLDKWHAKTQPAVDTAPRSRLLTHPAGAGAGASRSRLTDVLDAYLTTESSKLSAASTSTDGPGPRYDDATFYQSLLRELIASRSSNASGPAASSNAGAGGVLPTKLHVSGSAHKKVDTKASKGRKVRYTVHEKLENFMAPEDRSSWAEAARGEFFGSLFGRVGALDEGLDDEDGDGDGEARGDGDDDTEGAALRLFRS